MDLTKDLQLYPHLFGSSTASAITPYPHEGEKEFISEPNEYYDLLTKLRIFYPWEEDKKLELFPEEISYQAKFQIIQDFATKLIKNIEDINPKYAKLVNKHFWDLI